MKDIEKLADYIGEEIADAKKYAIDALEYKEKRPELAKGFYNKSLQEMEHATGFHNDVVAMINEYRKTNGDPPAPMQAIYDREHKKHIAAAAEVKVLQNMFKEG